MFVKSNLEINPSKNQPFPELATKSPKMASVLAYVQRLVKRFFSSMNSHGLHFFVDDQDD